MWHVRLRIGNARPCARCMKRLRPPSSGPPSTRASDTTSRGILTSRSLLAFASADWITLRTIGAARRGWNSRIDSASSTGLPRTRSITGRALYGDIRAWRCDAVNDFPTTRTRFLWRDDTVALLLLRRARAGLGRRGLGD